MRRARIVLGIALLSVCLTARRAVAPEAAPAAEPPSRVDAMLQARRASAYARVGGTALCFAPGTPQSYVQEVVAGALVSADAKAFQAREFLRWSRTATDGSGLQLGDPTTLTWSIVADGVDVPGGFGAQAGKSELRSFLRSIYGSEAKYTEQFQAVFDRWSELTGVTYVHEPEDDGATLGSASGRLGVRADIRIAGIPIDGSFGVLAYNGFPNDGDMVLDTTDGFFRATGQNSRRLRNVVAHEHGHGLALDHVCPGNRTKLMEPLASTSFNGPQHDDILGAQRMYGDRHEPNDTRTTPTDLGAPGATLTLDQLSIDDNSDADWFRFTAAAGASIDVSLRPDGRSYNEGPTNQSGGCGAGTRIDTRTLVDLQFSVFDRSGALIATVNDVGAGEAESVFDLPLPDGAGDYSLRVRGGGENDAQLYELEITLTQRGARPDAVDDAATTFEVLPVSIDVLGNDNGLTDVPIGLQITSPPISGETKRDGDRLVYVPARDFVGNETFTYEVRDAHGQTSSADVQVDVRASALAGNARNDGDGDGYSDEFEGFRGTAADSAGSRPGEDISGGATELSITKLTASLRPKKATSDAIAVRGTLPVPQGFDPDGAVVVVNVGGIDRSFTLNAKGRGKLANGASFRLRLKRRRGVVQAGNARFAMKSLRTDAAAELADEGLVTDRRQKNEPRAVTVYVLFDDRTYRTTAALLYSAKTDRSGKAKLVK